MKRAFSLVELSIVLVILGLLVGGVLSGQSLIHAAELRSVTNDYNKYLTAVQTFRDKYFGLPGDFNNATNFWGSLGGSGLISDTAGCNSLPYNGTATCNGDTSGQIDTLEAYRFWQHLTNAGIIEGKYTGCRVPACGNSAINAISGVNVPPSKLNNGIYIIYNNLVAYSSTTTQFAGDYGNTLYLSAIASGIAPAAPILPPQDAWNIDKKLDDGAPGTGRIMVQKGDGVTTFCTSVAGTTTDTGATYQLTNSNKDCLLYYIRIF